MKIIGITGGIGSGKTLVCRVFACLGIAVFYADEVAKELYEDDPVLVETIRERFGDEILHSGKINKSKLGEIIFADKSKLSALNSLVHPAVSRAFLKWKKNQTSPYIIRESAILIESKSYLDCDHIIQITAPEPLRIQRVMQRSNLNEQQIRSRISEQMTEDERRPFCDFEIPNDEKHLILGTILEMHRKIMA